MRVLRWAEDGAAPGVRLRTGPRDRGATGGHAPWRAHRSSSSRVLARRLGVGRGRRTAPGRRPRRHGPHAARPGVEGRRPIDDHVPGSRRRDRRCDPGGAGAGRPRRPQRDRVLRLRRQRRRPGPDRGDGLRRHRPGQGRARPLVRRRREADGVGRGQGGGEPRRAERGAARHVPRAGRPGAREPHPRGARVHERRPDGHSGDDHRDRLHVRGVPGGRPGAPRLGVPRRPRRAAERHLGRPADQPLADVVATGGRRPDHRRRREPRRGPG